MRQILGDAPMELDEFSKLFALVLSQYDVGSIPVSLDRVNVGDMPRLAHRACPVVFLLGADDGAIPAAAPSPGLLNDDDREPAGLLRAGAGPPAVRQAVPGDDHRLRDLRPAPAALLCELGGRLGRTGRSGGPPSSSPS